ncbi:stage II sporulation protein P [Sporolactobacillus sp. THM7-7]|nr:stage II sporulation protein P [Sporolactobacillus sp. THM7-7]
MTGGTSLKHRIPPKSPSLFQELFSRYVFLLILIYGMAILIIVGQVKINFIDEALQKAEWPSDTLLRETLGNENVLFNHAVKDTLPTKNIYHLMLEAMTDIRFDDVRSLFGSELPGFSLYNTKIFIAGEGLDYTNLPKESPPPPEIILEKPSPKKPEKKKPEPPANSNMKRVVFIYHTHPWESYKPALKGEKNEASATSYDSDRNVAMDGAKVGEVLSENGIGFIHDKSNGWGYNEAYQASRKVVRAAIKKNPDVTYLIDIHRDSAPKTFTTTSIRQSRYARISFIIGEANPNYSANLYLAKQLKKHLDKRYPGLVRGVVGKTKYDGNGIYNQDLSKNALLVEIGGVDNTVDEVSRASEAFAEALSAVIKERTK